MSEVCVEELEGHVFEISHPPDEWTGTIRNLGGIRVAAARNILRATA
jgi:hypothetical protein